MSCGRPPSTCLPLKLLLHSISTAGERQAVLQRCRAEERKSERTEFSRDAFELGFQEEVELSQVKVLDRKTPVGESTGPARAEAGNEVGRLKRESGLLSEFVTEESGSRLWSLD